MLLWLLSLVAATFAWPDGAPCVHAAFESMNPLEAVEHQGGLRLDAPPYEIHVDQKCYWRNQPISLTLQGRNDSMWFKGFVIQPFQWNNDQLGPRIGQLVRLDDNGSWQQQCFRFKDSATHSHNEKKKHMRMWWRVDDESQTVQFVATVVKHQTEFWVKSVRSRPIPPCRLNRNGITDYSAPMPAVPPPVKAFKMDTHNLFDHEAVTPRANEITSAPTTPVPTSRVISNTVAQTTKRLQTPTSVPDRMNRIIPLPQMEVVHRHTSDDNSNINVVTTPQPVFTTRAQLVAQNRRFGSREFAQPRPVVNTNLRPTGGVCVDRDSQVRCKAWLQYCRAPQFFSYMSSFCRRTCGFC